MPSRPTIERLRSALSRSARGPRFRRRPLAKVSFRVRLTLLFVAIFGSTLVVFSFFMYRATLRNLEAEFDTALYNHAVDVAQTVDVDLFGDLSLRSDPLSQGEKVFPFSLGKGLLQIRRIGGEVIASSRGMARVQLPFDAATQELLLHHGVTFSDVDIPQGAFETEKERRPPEKSRVGRLFSRPQKTTSYRLINYLIERPQIEAVLQIAVPLAFVERERGGLRAFFLIAIPSVLILAALGGLFLSRRALLPISAITAKAQRITAQELGERVPVPEVEDELWHLATTLNALLSRLQDAFESQERFIADASHQLKTPLAIMRGELDVFRRSGSKPEEMAEFLKSASGEIDYLSRMVEDLLLLARMGAGRGSLALQRVRLDEVLLGSVSSLERAAKARDVSIRLDLAAVPEAQAYEIDGDPDLLQCMARNLIENALKFSPPGGRVDIRLEADPRSYSISVRDQGPGIGPAERERIFERFYRASGSSGVPGTGLGLPIALRIAQIHGGAIEVESEAGAGSLFRARLARTS
jgi:signal transduction histidine kinase